MHDEFKQHTGLLSPWVDGMRCRKVAAEIPPGSKILDIGCGPGLIKQVLPAHCLYAGIDLSIDVVRANRERFPKDRYVDLDVTTTALPFTNNEFDVVVMAAFIEHIDAPGPLFTEIARVLKPNGKVIATTPSKWGGFVHEILAHSGFLSHDAAEEHKGFWDKNKMEESLKGTALMLKSYVPFQFGLNQLFILERRPS